MQISNLAFQIRQEDNKQQGNSHTSTHHSSIVIDRVNFFFLRSNNSSTSQYINIKHHELLGRLEWSLESKNEIISTNIRKINPFTIDNGGSELIVFLLVNRNFQSPSIETVIFQIDSNNVLQQLNTITTDMKFPSYEIIYVSVLHLQSYTIPSLSITDESFPPLLPSPSTNLPPTSISSTILPSPSTTIRPSPSTNILPPTTELKLKDIPSGMQMSIAKLIERQNFTFDINFIMELKSTQFLLKLTRNPHVDIKIISDLSYDSILEYAGYDVYLADLITTDNFYIDYIRYNFGVDILNEKPDYWFDINKKKEILYYRSDILKHPTILMTYKEWFHYILSVVNPICNISRLENAIEHNLYHLFRYCMEDERIVQIFFQHIIIDSIYYIWHRVICTKNIKFIELFSLKSGPYYVYDITEGLSNAVETGDVNFFDEYYDHFSDKFTNIEQHVNDIYYAALTCDNIDMIRKVVDMFHIDENNIFDNIFQGGHYYSIFSNATPLTLQYIFGYTLNQLYHMLGTPKHLRLIYNNGFGGNYDIIINNTREGNDDVEELLDDDIYPYHIPIGKINDRYLFYSEDNISLNSSSQGQNEREDNEVNNEQLIMHYRLLELDFFSNVQRFHLQQIIEFIRDGMSDYVIEYLLILMFGLKHKGLYELSLNDPESHIPHGIVNNNVVQQYFYLLFNTLCERGDLITFQRIWNRVSPYIKVNNEFILPLHYTYTDVYNRDSDDEEDVEEGDVEEGDVDDEEDGDGDTTDEEEEGDIDEGGNIDEGGIDDEDVEDEDENMDNNVNTYNITQKVSVPDNRWYTSAVISGNINFVKYFNEQHRLYPITVDRSEISKYYRNYDVNMIKRDNVTIKLFNQYIEYAIPVILLSLYGNNIDLYNYLNDMYYRSTTQTSLSKKFGSFIAGLQENPFDEYSKYRDNDDKLDDSKTFFSPNVNLMFFAKLIDNNLTDVLDGIILSSRRKYISQNDSSINNVWNRGNNSNNNSDSDNTTIEPAVKKRSPLLSNSIEYRRSSNYLDLFNSLDISDVYFNFTRNYLLYTRQERYKIDDNIIRHMMTNYRMSPSIIYNYICYETDIHKNGNRNDIMYLIKTLAKEDVLDMEQFYNSYNKSYHIIESYYKQLIYDIIHSMLNSNVNGKLHLQSKDQIKQILKLSFANGDFSLIDKIKVDNMILYISYAEFLDCLTSALILPIPSEARRKELKADTYIENAYSKEKKMKALMKHSLPDDEYKYYWKNIMRLRQLSGDNIDIFRKYHIKVMFPENFPAIINNIYQGDFIMPRNGDVKAVYDIIKGWMIQVYSIKNSMTYMILRNFKYVLYEYIYPSLPNNYQILFLESMIKDQNYNMFALFENELKRNILLENVIEYDNVTVFSYLIEIDIETLGIEEAFTDDMIYNIMYYDAINIYQYIVNTFHITWNVGTLEMISATSAGHIREYLALN